MHRTLIYEISAEATPLKIEHFLRQKGYSRGLLTYLKKEDGSVLTNGKPRYMNEYLKANDTLTVHIRETSVSEKIEPVNLPIDILYEDEDILVVNKPSGMPIHPSLHNYGNTLANALAYYFSVQNKPFVFRCSNRLDKGTSGVTLISKNMLSAGILSSMMMEKHIQREYLAIVRGEDLPDAGTIDAPIGRKPDSIIERQIDFEHGEHAVTHYKVLKRENGHSLVSLNLETGRTHQIRIHMKYIGYPLIGDYLYYPDMENIKRQALHSYRMSFIHPVNGTKMSFLAPLPSDMADIISMPASLL